MTQQNSVLALSSRVLFAAFLAVGLQACGGGSSGSTPQVAEPAPAATPPPPPPPPPPPAQTQTPAPPAAPTPPSNSSSTGPKAAPGGFIESPILANPRPRLAQADINAFLPERGPFTFPAPYETRGVRITNASDCGGDGDCVTPVGYSYWRNINNHVNDAEMLIFLRLNPARGGDGPTLFSFHKESEQLTKVGPLFAADSKFRNHTGEGWYFSAQMPNTLYIRDGSKLVRYDVINRTFNTVFDVTDEFGSGHDAWQLNSSNDDRVHSGSLRSTKDGRELGCFVYNEDTAKFSWYPRSGKGTYDECQIDRSGRWLVIKDQMSGNNGMDNRIIDLTTGNERLLLDEDGAGGHSDMGYASTVMADDWDGRGTVWKAWDFTASALKGTAVYFNDHFNGMAPAHVSFSNARSDKPLTDQYACGSAASSREAVHTNEVICFMLDGSNDTLVVAPVMTDQGANGGGSSYNRMPKGNLDVTGEYFIWTSNMGGNRIDAFVVKVPHTKFANR